MLLLAFVLPEIALVYAQNRLLAPDPPAESAQLQACLETIAQIHFRPEQLTLVVSERGHFDNLRLTSQPVVLLRRLDDTRFLAPFHFRKVDAYVIVYNATDPDKLLGFLKSSYNWNPRAKFVVVFDEQGNPRRFLEAFMENYMSKVVGLKVRDGKVEGFVAGESRTEVCGDRKLFERGVLKRWNELRLKVATVGFGPYVCLDCPKKTGLDVYVLQFAKKLLGVKVSYLPKKYAHWGKLLPNGTYTEAYGDLQNNRADLGIGFFHMKFPENLHFDLSFPYAEDAFQWVVPAPRRRSHWQSALLVFNPQTWCLILALLVLVPGFFVVASRTISGETRSLKTFGGCFLIVYKSLLTQSVRPSPVASEIRYVFALWCTFGWIMATAFQSNLILFLNFDQYHKPIGNLQELLDSKLEFGFIGEVAEIYENQSGAIESYIYRNYRPCDLGYTCLNRTAFRKDFATVKSTRAAAKPDYYLDPETDAPSIRFLPEKVSHVAVTMAFAKGHPVYEGMNEVLLRMKSAGFIEYFYDVLEHGDNLVRTKRGGSGINSISLNLDEVQGIFGLLLMGCLMGLVAFVVEYLSCRVEYVKC